jgi:hypothetical protein
MQPDTGLVVGCVMLLSGVWVAIRIGLAKKVHRSDIMDSDAIVTEEDKTTEVRLSLTKRIIILSICLIATVIGVSLICKNHNRLHSRGATNPLTRRNI